GTDACAWVTPQGHEPGIFPSDPSVRACRSHSTTSLRARRLPRVQTPTLNGHGRWRGPDAFVARPSAALTLAQMTSASADIGIACTIRSMTAPTGGLKARLRRVPFLARAKARVFGPRPPAQRPGAAIIRDYVDGLASGADLKVVFGGHWSSNPGWLLLTEADQDVTARLQFDDNRVDVVFAEHVIEHVPFVGGIHFL